MEGLLGVDRTAHNDLSSVFVLFCIVRVGKRCKLDNQEHLCRPRYDQLHRVCPAPLDAYTLCMHIT